MKDLSCVNHEIEVNVTYNFDDLEFTELQAVEKAIVILKKKAKELRGQDNQSGTS